ncbi:two-component system sensor histidine kinase CreC [Suttonella ornithocola]|uniref:histidine kinase n=1 Tax=Suttonella ornithocola TaxID=279832 RepID=A0A380MPQ6_9GAMM|nr:two-component system sensor histidine kinase CreC [Suttonella ornithocola]SUO94302.1 Sensor protein CreC [Suttonella ornithocola]
MMNDSVWRQKFSRIIPLGISLRLFFILLALLLLLGWQWFNRSSEVLKISMKQSAETTLVDTLWLLTAEQTKQYAQTGQLNINALAEQIHIAQHLPQTAKIYTHHKNHLELEVLLSNANGMVIYDSKQQAVGKDYSHWRDIHAALQGQYSARSSYLNEAHPEQGKEMVVSAPIFSPTGTVVGVLSLRQPVTAIMPFNLSAIAKMRYLMAGYLCFILGILALLAWWLARALRRITHYAEALAAGQKAPLPKFSDHYLARLAQTVSKLRSDLEAKQAVEQTITTLTHELKTPLTTAQATAELLSEPMLSAQEQKALTVQIQRAGNKMQTLIERLLALARLENRPQLMYETVSLSKIAKAIMTDYELSLSAQALSMALVIEEENSIEGEALLIRQAITNLLDNAIAFAKKASTITIVIKPREVWIENIGETIPDYALRKLTERFFSLPRPDGSGKSSGLGLNIVLHIMLLHHGRLEIENITNGVRARLIFKR